MTSFSTSFGEPFGLRFPLIMAPMFLVSNREMMQSALRSGIMGVFPTLNYREKGQLAAELDALSVCKTSGNFSGHVGVNLIVQKTNPFLNEHLAVCIEKRVPFFITSLGNPAPVIQAAETYGAKVYCDVTGMAHAEKCVREGCHGLVAVGQGAGGHAGPHPLSILVPALKRNFPGIPVIAAGGMGNGAGMLSAAALGADGFSVGTAYIASVEASVQMAYKEAIIQSGLEDIVLTERLSGTPCNIINTPYAQKIGYKQNSFERFLSRNKRTRKLFKGWLQYAGMEKLYASVQPGNHNNLWTAGKSAELIEEILPCDAITDKFIREFAEAFQQVASKLKS